MIDNGSLSNCGIFLTLKLFRQKDDKKLLNLPFGVPTLYSTIGRKYRNYFCTHSDKFKSEF